MKKIFLVGVLALFGMMNAQQQRFGLKAGLNFANVSNTQGSSITSFYGGIFMNVPINAQFHFQNEILYNAKGVKGTVDLTEIGGTGTAVITMHLNYISIPAMFQYNPAPEFYIEAGPEFSLMVGANAKMLNMSRDIMDVFHRFDFGLGIGAGYYFSSANIGITARYVTGLTDIIKDNPDKASYNGVFQLGIAYKFKK
jgi:hypothetical protein